MKHSESSSKAQEFVLKHGVARRGRLASAVVTNMTKCNEYVSFIVLAVACVMALGNSEVIQ